MITLYSQEGCPQCKMFHMVMDKKKIQYENCTDLKIMAEKGIHHTPTLEVDGKLMVGKEAMDYIKQL